MDPLDPVNESNAAAIIAVAREAERNLPQKHSIGGIEVLLYPDKTVKSLEHLADQPRRKRGAAQLYETASFIDYVNRHKLPNQTHIFGQANELGGGFTAVLDFHKAEERNAVGGTNLLLAAWGQHSAALKLETTPEWGRWMAKNSKLMSQEEFAEFIEDNLTDIIEPDAASVLEVAQGLQGRKNVSFKSGKNLRDGAITLEYVETIEVQGSTARRDDSFKVPEKITLGIIPFVGAEGVKIEARLRFRIGNDGKLAFAYVLNRPFKVVETAFLLARTEIEEKTGINVMLGSGSCAAPAHVV